MFDLTLNDGALPLGAIVATHAQNLQGCNDWSEWVAELVSRQLRARHTFRSEAR